MVLKKTLVDLARLEEAKLEIWRKNKAKTIGFQQAQHSIFWVFGSLENKSCKREILCWIDIEHQLGIPRA